MRATRSHLPMPTYSSRGRAIGARPGIALINAMMILAVFTIMLVTGISYTQQSFKASRASQSDQQVYNIARAGLVDAINWFKRQPVQPVPYFKPNYNSAVPSKGECNDPYRIDPGDPGGKVDPSTGGGGVNDKPWLGIVQEMPLDNDGLLWGRYEVGKITKLTRGTNGKLTVYSIMEQDASGNWIAQAVGDAKSTKWEGVQDVSHNYGLDTDGLVWRIRSHGYVYRKSPDAPAGTRFYQQPNEVISQIELETEIRRLDVKDYTCAIHVNGRAPTTTRFNNGNKVIVVAPDGYAVKFCVNNINPGSAPSSFQSGLGSPYQPGATDTLDWFEEFGVADGPTMASMADFLVTDLSQLPERMSSMALTYINGNATFTASRPLGGGGILVVNGDLTLQQDSGSTFAGVIYVRGNYTQGSPSALSGQVVVNGNTTVSAPSDTANIEYSPSIINEVRRQLGQYRERRSGQTVVSP